MKNLQQLLAILLVFCLSYSFTLVFGQTDLTPYPNNPVIPYGSSGSWDSGIIYLPDVVQKDNVYYLFYSGSSNLMTTPLAIGYATSLDGYSWTKNSSNPVFEADGNGFDAFMIAEGKIIIEDSLWILYYNARSVGGPGPGPSIGRATSTSADGPWDRMNDPILTTGSSGEWDAAFITPNAVLTVDTGYIMYYSGGTGYPLPPSDHAMVGLAFSSDGINWTKYDDPLTTDPPFAESDPVLVLGSAGSYDSGLAWECDVLKTENGFEMFYTGDPDSWSGERICYATSVDGINWFKYEQNPILTDMQNWATIDLVAPSAIKIGDEYFVYYIGNTTLFNGQIGFATSPVVTSVDSNKEDGSIKTFQLYQNYPNPFNPSTIISWKLASRSFVTLKVYDVLGNEVETLINEEKPAGIYKFNFDGSDLTSGVYFYELHTGQSLATKKMILLR
jgi:predicted GH43/DUF377 family glycosyl hydrolase